MPRIAVLSDRSPQDALPALGSMSLDVKAEPLSHLSLPHLTDLSPGAVVIDGEESPDQAYRLASTLATDRFAAPVVIVLARTDLERFPWHEVADEVLFSGSSAAEVRVRLAMLTRRTGGSGEATFRLGPVTMDVESYRVMAGGRILDLTYREFQLLRFLVQRPGRVFTRSALLQEVWGYDFYGGTRTVDVHIRRLRSKLGPEYEGLIETVRGVGYRATDPRSRDEEV